MQANILNFFALQRSIFGICPDCGDFFRLSDCQIYLKKQPVSDWMDELNLQTAKLDKAEERICQQEDELREVAREKGRRLAQRAIKKVDAIFAPRRLNPDDAKVIFHPIDYVVFNGMKAASPMKDIVLLDNKARLDRRSLQRSIERAIEQENYEWQTLRIDNDGKIRTE